MRIITIKAFKFDELSEQAKNVARETYRNDRMTDQNPWIDEDMESIRLICKACNCEYEIDSYNHCYLTLQDEFNNEEILELNGTRAMVYIWNNFIEPNLKGKYISNGWVDKRHRSYYSKVTKEFSCPFTGYCADMLLWDAWQYWKEDVRKYNHETTVECFLNRVGYTIENYLDEEDRYYDSDECVDEMISSDDVEFTEEGELI
jgi:hypothetical protein